MEQRASPPVLSQKWMSAEELPPPCFLALLQRLLPNLPLANPPTPASQGQLHSPPGSEGGQPSPPQHSVQRRKSAKQVPAQWSGGRLVSPFAAPNRGLQRDRFWPAGVKATMSQALAPTPAVSRSLSRELCPPQYSSPLSLPFLSSSSNLRACQTPASQPPHSISSSGNLPRMTSALCNRSLHRYR
jgi:hypothetical protein